MQQDVERCRRCFSRLEFEQKPMTQIRKTGAESAPDSLQDRISSLLHNFKKKA
jgi:hypothetical protein